MNSYFIFVVEIDTIQWKESLVNPLFFFSIRIPIDNELNDLLIYLLPSNRGKGVFWYQLVFAAYNMKTKIIQFFLITSGISLSTPSITEHHFNGNFNLSMEYSLKLNEILIFGIKRKKCWILFRIQCLYIESNSTTP